MVSTLNPFNNLNAAQSFSLLGLDNNQMTTQASQMNPAQLQALVQMTSPWQDEYNSAMQPNFAIPAAAQMPFNVPTPSSAYTAMMPSMSPTYAIGNAGTGPGGMINYGALQQQMPQIQQLQQQALINQAYNGSAIGLPGGGMGGLNGLSLPPGAEQMTADEAKDAQLQQFNQYLNNWQEAIGIANGIQGAQHSVAMSIIQNIR